MGNSSAVKKKHWALYEDLLQEGKSEKVVKNRFNRKYEGKLKQKDKDEAWEKFMEGYREKYPKKKSKKKRQPENDPGDNANIAARRDSSSSTASISHSEGDFWHTKMQFVLAEIKSEKLQYRRDIVEAHQKEVAELSSQERWTVKLNVKGRYQKRYKQNSPRANTACYWQVELMEDLGASTEDDLDDLPVPGGTLKMEPQRTLDANTPNYADFESLDEERNINRTSRSLSGLSTGSAPMYNGSSYGGFMVPSDTMSVRSGVSNVSSRVSYTSQPNSVVLDQHGRVSGYLVQGNPGVPVVVAQPNQGVPMVMAQSNPGPFVTQAAMQPQYVMAQPNVMMQQPYVTQGTMQQQYGPPMSGSHTSFSSHPSSSTLPRTNTRSSIASSDTTTSSRSRKRNPPRTRRKRKSQDKTNG